MISGSGGMVDAFPESVKFNKSWRIYQERVLSELKNHLDDNHLHLVAAPGSGKTVLGLEVVRRLNKPTLILSPTLTIRNQWLDRLLELFLPEGSSVPTWISMDIRNPGFLTIATYQALHSVYTNRYIEGQKDKEDVIEEEGNGSVDCQEKVKSSKLEEIDLIKLLNDAGVGTVVVDEAHHLRTEWWKSLIAVTARLNKPTVIALTATPPYDVNPQEWRRYQDLCGPVDYEICVPELVQTGDLCPHQDYVYFSTPSREESECINDFRSSVERFILDISKDAVFIETLTRHPWLVAGDCFIEQILNRPDYYSSMAIFLNHAGQPVPDRFFDIMGIPKRKLPELNKEWLEILLTECLFNDLERFEHSRAHLLEVKKNLASIGAIENRNVTLQSTSEISKLLTGSISKLDSILDIVKFESSALGADLRMVVLTDYIRKAYLPGAADDLKPLNKIGVVTIFEKIRREGIEGITLGVLSGSLVIVPKSAEGQLRRIAQAHEGAELTIETLACDENYLLVSLAAEDRYKIVHMVTDLFTAGGITVLVGTKSLLGEGWDAPSINSLILASFVGTYMLSNQMRGRAIRKQNGNPVKTANVWHLVCAELNRPVCEDYEMLARRFKAFLGISFVKERVIENGLARLGIGFPPYSTERIQLLNNAMKRASMDRKGLKKKWDEALKKSGTDVQVIHEIKAPKTSLPRNFVFFNTISALLWQGITWGGSVFGRIMEAGQRVQSEQQGWKIFMGACIAAAVVALPMCLKALWLFIRNAPVESNVRQISESLLKTLIYIEAIKSSESDLKIDAGNVGRGGFSCSLRGGTTYEKALFLEAFEEMIGPIDNPRYILVRKTPIGRMLREDYHTVPTIVASRKEFAEYFADMWSSRVGAMALVFTRTEEGRRVLLKARTRSLASAFQKKSEKRICWK
jgi:superfamily II DNA or RNA helicase